MPRSDHLGIQSWHGIREVSPGQFEVPLTVNHRGRRMGEPGERARTHARRVRVQGLSERTCAYDDRGKDVKIVDR
ncbi:MAG: hypothetical protein IPK07_28050 [Deltaproteobacteria bacterium]|nr:hypothetical protein [Deltaproteobacteria bacterium]